VKRIFYILVAILPLHCSSLFSQTPINELMSEVRTRNAREGTSGLSYGEIEGSPYFSDEFIDGKVYLKSGKSAAIPIRYNLYTDEVEFMRDGMVHDLIKDDVKYIEQGEEVIYQENSTYYFSQESGKFSLYIKKRVSFHDKVSARAYYDPEPAKFKRDMDEYYLKEENKPAREIKNKKTLQEMLGENEAALDFIKKSKIKATKAEDLLELVRFLNAQSQTPE